MPATRAFFNIDAIMDVDIITAVITDISVHQGGQAEMQIRCDGTRAIVTAGGSGLGRKIAEALMEVGATVHVCDVSASALAELSAEHPTIGTAVADVADVAALDTFFTQATQAMGGLDVLVNNAGIAGPTARIEDIAVEDWDKTVAIDLNAQFYATRRAVPLMRAAGGGAIINISSVAGRLGYPMRTPYAAAKWGVIGLTQSLAMELGADSIRVNAILPGSLDGERMQRVIAARMAATGMTYEEVYALEVGGSSMGRFIPPEDVAAMVCYLSSPYGRLISGQSIGICGNFEVLR
jgi:NAD(P)-dependent dehydrogenase (short-subunit alcohol dehydrogenase family)